MCFCSKMNNTTKTQQACGVICKKTCRIQSHERDLYRVCPSKLSKRELENLYFALLENNLELKKTLHSQQDKLKVLSTKLQRMTVVQRNAAGKEKDCCNSKVLVKEQKEIIADLKRDNEQMSERIRLLNMRLCSAKQFLKRSSSQAAKCPRCGICPAAAKNSSMSAIDAKPSQASVKMSAASCQYILNEASEVPKSTREVETETDQNEIEGTEKHCNENKCRTVMDELKQKIVNLQEELSKTHAEYSKRISKLENDVSGLHQENTRVRSSKAASDHTLQQKEKKADDLRGKLRDAEGKVNDLKMQLTIEKRKVKELETTLKLAKTSSQAAQFMEKLNTPKPKPAPATDASGSVSSYYSAKQTGSRSPSPRICTCKNELRQRQRSDQLSPTPAKSKVDGKPPKSDDSGCTDLNKSSDAEESKKNENKSDLLSPTPAKLKQDGKSPKSHDSGCTACKSSDAEESKTLYVERLNQQMLEKISNLQMQLDGFRIKAAGQSAKTEEPKSDLDNYDYEDEVQMTVITITDPNVVLEIQELGDERKYSKPEKDMNTSTPIKDSDLTSISSKTGPANVKSWNDLVQDMGRTSYKTDEFGTRNDHPSLDKPNFSEPKQEDDNKYQIPGPIPITYQTYKEKKKSLKSIKTTSKNKKDNEINDLIHKKESCEEKGVKIHDSSDSDVKENKTSYKQSKSGFKSNVTAVKSNETPVKNDDSPKGQSQKIKIVDPKEVPGTSDAKTTSEDPTSALKHIYTDSLKPNKENKSAEDVKKVQIKAKNEKMSVDDLAEVKKESSNYFCQSDTIITPPQSIDSQSSKEKMASAQTDKPENKSMEGRMDEFGLPVEIGQWPPPASPALASSKVPQPTVPPPAGQPAPRRDSATYTATPARRDSGTYTAMPVLRDSATFTKPDELEDCERGTSPANTERDVSSLSDLPPEKDGKSPRASPLTSPRDTRSPGEEKASSTYTESDTRTYDYGPLSDGELPTQATFIKPRKLSFGEQPTYGPALPQNSDAQMEATLNAISEELAHCRKLLAAARDHERPSGVSALCGSSTAVAADVAGGAGRDCVHRLHATPASRRLPDTVTHTCVFTLHIGTLVLSDEAVLSSRDKSLVLTWQFYEQAAAMTRMRSGRVVLFDFSTEYDVAFNEDFLNYMKQEEMPLTICDINRQDEPFATCSLPLRDALINTNRRVDMSLALMAGPAFRSWSKESAGRDVDPLVSGDELGVLDLWCCLRAPTQAFNTSVARSPMADATSKDLVRSNSRMDIQSVDYDQENIMSQDMLLEPRNTQSAKTFQNPKSSSERSVVMDRRWSFDRRSSNMPPSIIDIRNSDTPTVTERPQQSSKHSVQTQKLFFTSDKQPVEGNWPSRRRRSSSALIPNEVPANIKSTAEMKKALERNVQTMCRIPKTDEEISQAHTSLCSIRNAAEKQRMHKMFSTKQMTSRVPEGLEDMLKKERKLSMVAAAAARESSARKKLVPFTQNSQDTEHNVQNQYNNIGQFIGLNKILEQSKKTVTYTDAAPDAAVKENLMTQESSDDNQASQSIDITVLWLALNEECEAMVNPQVQRLYVAYTFMGRHGADLETPISLPKPKHYAEKCYFNFKKTFNLHDADLPLLGHMSRCRAGRSAADPRDCIVFSVVSEPPEDPLGLASCLDIGHAYLYLGDILAYSAGGAGYTEVVPVRVAGRGPGPGAVCGVLAVRVDGLHVLRRGLSLQPLA